MGNFIDMTDWIMSEHGVPHSRWKVVRRVNDYISPNGKHLVQWLCECSCENHTQKIVIGTSLKNGLSLSCGCLKKEISYINGCANKGYNNYKINGDIVTIYFNNIDEYTQINVDKWNTIPGIQELCWFKDSQGYARANITQKLQHIFYGKTSVLLHQLICPCEIGFEPDHLDRNRLNNLTDNLKPKTHEDNNRNKNHMERKIAKNNTSGVTGIYWVKKKQCWCASISVDCKRIHLGYFIKKEDAINARKNAELQYFIKSNTDEVNT